MLDHTSTWIKRLNDLICVGLLRGREDNYLKRPSYHLQKVVHEGPEADSAGEWAAFVKHKLHI
jgi:hypothetical protein